MLGDREKIKVFADPWVRGKTNYMLDNTVTTAARNLRVCELFTPGVKQWDEQKVNNLISNCDAKIILAMPIPRCQVADRIAWMHTVDGKYTVKSGYKFWHDQFSECRRNPVSKGWSKLWNLDVPQKIKVFLWRICMNNVPVRNLLKGKGVHTTIICPMCSNDVEHLLHIFLDCEFAKACWEGVGLNLNSLIVESCSEWLLQILETETKSKLNQVAVILWGIWSARNLKVQTQKVTGVNNRSVSHQSTSSYWVALAEGAFKINVDASIYVGSQNYGIGMVIRDYRGVFCKARSVCRAGQISVFEAETNDVLEAIRWAQELEIQKVIIESDSMLTVQAINQGTTNHLDVGNVLQESRMMLEIYPHFNVSFARKQANKVAHALARVPCQANCFVDFSSPPQLVLESLMYDALMC